MCKSVSFQTGGHHHQKKSGHKTKMLSRKKKTTKKIDKTFSVRIMNIYDKLTDGYTLSSVLWLKFFSSFFFLVNMYTIYMYLYTEMADVERVIFDNVAIKY